jgi:hypothetical protein
MNRTRIELVPRASPGDLAVNTRLFSGFSHE